MTGDPRNPQTLSGAAMTGDPRNAQTLDEACANGDGTFNGYRLFSWLSEATSPGKGLPEAEVRRLVDEARAKRNPTT
jgi:hypothetical protein